MYISQNKCFWSTIVVRNLRLKLKNYFNKHRPEADLRGREGGAQGERALPIFCNHFEELQTMLFEVEEIINNAPLIYVYPKYYQNMFKGALSGLR